MTEINLSEVFLTAMLTYGAPALGLALLAGALGIPLPGTLLLLAAGAFGRQGMLDLWIAAACGLAGVILGDSLSYGFGRFAKGPVERRFGRAAAWHKGQNLLQQRGGLAIFLTRFLLTALAIPVNLVAGSGGYPFWRFLAFDLSGELVWIILYIGLGYFVGSQFELLNSLISDFGGALIGLIIAIAGFYFFIRWQRAIRNKTRHSHAR